MLGRSGGGVDTVDETTGNEIHWPLRAWTLAVLGGLIAVAIERLGAMPRPDGVWARSLEAASIFLGVSGLAFGLAWVRGRLAGAVVVALLCGLIAGGVLLWNLTPMHYATDEGWRLASGFVAASFLLVLYQAGQDRAAGRPARWTPGGLRAWKRESIRYADVHGHLWANALMLAASLLFAGIAFGLAHLLAEMFALVKLGFLRRLLRENWFDAAICGTALGIALGLLRERGAIIAALQRVVMIVLRVLAPVLAVGVFIFLAALPLTGLAPLWETGGTTPIMLGGAIIALILCNAVVDDSEADESRSVLLNACAAALGLFLVPMVGIAAFSSWLRVAQHGLSPERLWALAFIIVGGIVALGYAVTILGRRGWFARLRRTNLRLVFLLAGVALLLSTPLVGFERIATAHQLHRLATGQVSAEEFDYRALWFEFGPAGQAAIRELAHAADPRIRRYAKAVQRLASAYDPPPNARGGAPLESRLTILPRPVPIDDALRTRLLDWNACGTEGRCLLRYVPGESVAILVSYPGPLCEGCPPAVWLLERGEGDWKGSAEILAQGEAARAAEAAVRAGAVSFRAVTRRQLYLGTEAVGDPIPLENEAAP